MAINRNYLQCSVCKEKIITRTAIAHTSYQEFAFPCPNCGVEIRFGMKIGQRRPSIKYTTPSNAKWINVDNSIRNVEVFDAEALNPIQKHRYFSPFSATALLPQNMPLFARQRTLRLHIVRNIWPIIQKLEIHLTRKQWHLFDKQFKKIDLDNIPSTPEMRASKYYDLLDIYGQLFCPFSRPQIENIKQRITLASAISGEGIRDLVKYFKSKGKDEEINHQIHDLRRRWIEIFGILEPLYLIFYWDNNNSLDDYTLAQKRFDYLKSFYVDLFETFCRISVIAATLEGIIFRGEAVVPINGGEIEIKAFDLTANGAKPQILTGLVIADLFVPYIDHNLRNGIGHHSANYNIATDDIEYVSESKKQRKQYRISYIRFCEKVLRLYGQLEIVSQYLKLLILAEKTVNR